MAKKEFKEYLEGLVDAHIIQKVGEKQVIVPLNQKEFKSPKEIVEKGPPLDLLPAQLKTDTHARLDQSIFSYTKFDQGQAYLDPQIILKDVEGIMRQVSDDEEEKNKYFGIRMPGVERKIEEGHLTRFEGEHIRRRTRVLTYLQTFLNDEGEDEISEEQTLLRQLLVGLSVLGQDVPFYIFEEKVKKMSSIEMRKLSLVLLSASIRKIPIIDFLDQLNPELEIPPLTRESKRLTEIVPRDEASSFMKNAAKQFNPQIIS